METTDKNYSHYKANLDLLTRQAQEPLEDTFNEVDEHYLPWEFDPLELLNSLDPEDFEPTAEDIADFEEEYNEELEEDEINNYLDEVAI